MSVPLCRGSPWPMTCPRHVQRHTQTHIHPLRRHRCHQAPPQRTATAAVHWTGWRKRGQQWARRPAVDLPPAPAVEAAATSMAPPVRATYQTRNLQRPKVPGDRPKGKRFSLPPMRERAYRPRPGTVRPPNHPRHTLRSHGHHRVRTKHLLGTCHHCRRFVRETRVAVRVSQQRTSNRPRAQLDRVAVRAALMTMSARTSGTRPPVAVSAVNVSH